MVLSSHEHVFSKQEHAKGESHEDDAKGQDSSRITGQKIPGGRYGI